MFFFNDFFHTFLNSITNFISDTSGRVISFITPFATSLLIVYLALWGMAHLLGKIDEPFKDGLNRIVRIVVILSLALNVGLYSGHIVDFLYNGPTQLAAIVTDTTFSYTDADTADISNSLDDLFEKGFAQAERAWKEAGIMNGNFGLYFAFIAIIGFTLAVGAYAAFLILLSKVLLSILLALGPIFIILLMFKATQRFFESWFSQVINYGIMVIVSVVLIKLMTEIFSAYLEMALDWPEVSMVPTAYIAGSGIISILILRQVPQLAMSLGGGISLASQGFFSAMARKVLPPTGQAGRMGINKGAKLGVGLAKGTYGLARRGFSGNSIGR